MANPPDVQRSLEWGLRGLSRRDAQIARRIDAYFNPLSQDQKTLAERKWRAPTRPAKPQLPCDVGLFSDDKDQLDMCEMFQDPTNEE